MIKGNASKYVKLNVGGALFYTTIGTLTKHDNMLRAMFSGRMEVLTDSEGKVKYSWQRDLVFSCVECIPITLAFIDAYNNFF